MIIDRLENVELYRGLAPGLVLAMEWLRSHDVRAMAAGRHDVDGDRLFALVQDVQTRPAAQCRLEAHRKYHDVQYVATGVERMGYANLSRVTKVTEEYDAEKDVGFYDGPIDWVTVAAGYFTVFTPEDAHAPLCMVDAPAAVRKVVMKVAVE